MNPLPTIALAIALAAMPQATRAQPAMAWDSEVAEASARFGIPKEWIRRVIEAESGGQTTLDGRPIRSRVGAIGLMQLMPGTWRAMRRVNGLGDDPDNPRDNILAGTAYLREMFDRFGYPGLFAAYNAGPARYVGHLEHRQELPAETVAYVAKVTRGRARLVLSNTASTRTAFPDSIPAGPLAFPSQGTVMGAAERPSSVFFPIGASPTSPRPEVMPQATSPLTRRR